MSKIELLCGDCLELMKNIPDGSVDMVLTDPPYGVNFQSHRRKEKYDKIRNDDNLFFLDDLNENLFRIMKNNSHVYQFCEWSFFDKVKISFEKYFTLKNVIVWNKGNFGMGNYYRFKYEFCLFGIKGDKKIKSHSLADVIDCNGTNNPFHPTQKPIKLLKMFIEQSSEVGEIVFDPFMGSGSTGVACKLTNRKFIGIELDEKYFDIAKQRIENGFVQEKINDIDLNKFPLFQ